MNVLVPEGLVLGATAGAAAVAMTLVWALSLRLRNAGIVDVFWGVGFVLIAALAVWLGQGGGVRAALVLALTSVWGLRLALHIGWRSRGKPEDHRYQQFRANAGPSFWWRSLFTVFLLQGAVMWVVALPLTAALAVRGPNAPTLWDAAALLLWAAGMVFEAGADWQLARFKADPANRGKVCNRGFWGLSRHPNYFGDAVVWWGFGCFGLAVGAWWTLVGPALMTLLLRRVSGVTLLDSTLSQRRPGYRDYMRSTPSFVPRLPRRRRD